MNGTKIVLDTNAAIKLLEKQFILTSLGLNIDEAQFFTSVIVRMELLSKREMQEEEKQRIMSFLGDLTVLPLDEAIECKAIEIRRTTKLKLPDSIIAATSIVLDAILFTNDDRLLSFSWPGYKVIALP